MKSKSIKVVYFFLIGLVATQTAFLVNLLDKRDSILVLLLSVVIVLIYFLNDKKVFGIMKKAKSGYEYEIRLLKEENKRLYEFNRNYLEAIKKLKIEAKS